MDTNELVLTLYDRFAIIYLIDEQKEKQSKVKPGTTGPLYNLQDLFYKKYKKISDVPLRDLITINKWFKKLQPDEKKKLQQNNQYIKDIVVPRVSWFNEKNKLKFNNNDVMLLCSSFKYLPQRIKNYLEALKVKNSSKRSFDTDTVDSLKSRARKLEEEDFITNKSAGELYHKYSGHGSKVWNALARGEYTLLPAISEEDYMPTDSYLIESNDLGNLRNALHKNKEATLVPKSTRPKKKKTLSSPPPIEIEDLTPIPNLPPIEGLIGADNSSSLLQKKDFVVYRGMDLDSFKKWLGFEKDNNQDILNCINEKIKSNEGYIIFDPAPLSTSRNSREAWKFVRGNKGALFTISVNSAACGRDIRVFSEYGYEDEYLLQPGQKLKITKAKLYYSVFHIGAETTR